MTPGDITRVHIVGAGPVGLLLTALLQGIGTFEVRLYEKRRQYTRSRMVKLAPYLVADTIDAYRADPIDGDNVEAVFEPHELEESLTFRQSMPPSLRMLLTEWTHGFCRLNDIEEGLRAHIEEDPNQCVTFVEAALDVDAVRAMIRPGEIVVDCTGCKSLLRDHLVQGAAGPHANTVNIRLEYAAVITFLYGRQYECNEFCKYYKNLDNTDYKFIPAVDRTVYDDGLSHVTGIVSISERDFQAMPPQCDGAWLRANFPGVAASMDRFIDKVQQETQGEIVGDLEVIRIPLVLYHAVRSTNRAWLRAGGNDPFARSPVLLAGDAAIGSPYFQSISLGFECAMFLAGLLTQQGMSTDEILERYEMLLYKQWLRVYMRSKFIKHNKDLFALVDDTFGLLERLHIY
jgi:2-polyprenyl-6-methoxyphenol hydroxylase-like FAD-dependent oxidoreductase